MIDELSDANRVVYIGDSLMKDVAMARSVGAIDVWAKYGVAQNRKEYDLLRRVTHWTDADVEREKEIAERPHVSPTVVLDRSFDELLRHFEFVKNDRAVPAELGGVPWQGGGESCTACARAWV
jgi:phosphoglycolate phosphatase